MLRKFQVSPSNISYNKAWKYFHRITSVNNFGSYFKSSQHLLKSILQPEDKSPLLPYILTVKSDLNNTPISPVFSLLKTSGFGKTDPPSPVFLLSLSMWIMCLFALYGSLRATTPNPDECAGVCIFLIFFSLANTVFKQKMHLAGFSDTKQPTEETLHTHHLTLNYQPLYFVHALLPDCAGKEPVPVCLSLCTAGTRGKSHPSHKASLRGR